MRVSCTFAIKKSFFCYFFFTSLNGLNPFTVLIQLISINNSIFAIYYELLLPFVSTFSLIAWTSFSIITSQYLKKRFYLAKIKRKNPLNSSSKMSHFGSFYKVKFETKARILAMRLAMRGCWRPSIQKKFFFEFYVRNIIIIFH